MKAIVCILMLLVSVSALAAGPTLKLGPATVSGTTLTFPVTLTNVPGTSISGIAVDIIFNRVSDVVALKLDNGNPISATAGAAATAAGIQLSQSSPQDGVLKIIIVNLSNPTPIGDGVVAQVSFDIISTSEITNESFGVAPTATNLAGKTTTITGAVNLFASSSFPQGDVNNDTMVNVFDALLTLQYSVDLIPHTAENNARYLGYADVAPLDATGKPKGDGVVNVFDALAILRHAVNLDTW